MERARIAPYWKRPLPPPRPIMTAPYGHKPCIFQGVLPPTPSPNVSQPQPPATMRSSSCSSRSVSIDSQDAPLSLTHDADVVEGLLSLSPLNSPQLATCVDMFTTPDIADIIAERPQPKAAGQFWVSASRAPPREHSVPAPTSQGAPAVVPCPSPTPLTKESMSEWESYCERRRRHGLGEHPLTAILAPAARVHLINSNSNDKFGTSMLHNPHVGIGGFAPHSPE